MASQRAEQSPWLRVLISIVVVVLLAPILVMGVMMLMMGLMGGWAGGTTGSVVGMSPLLGVGMMLLFLLVLLGAGSLVYRALTRGSSAVDDPALEELRFAYARGELSREEFEQRQEHLRQSE